MKKNARRRAEIIKRQKQTGGGRITKQEMKIIESPAYMELSLKLGASAHGNMPRADNDAIEICVEPPTKRLQQVLNSVADQNIEDNTLSSGDRIEDDTVNTNESIIQFTNDIQSSNLRSNFRIASDDDGAQVTMTAQSTTQINGKRKKLFQNNSF